MATSIYFPSSQRPNGYRGSNGLPVYSSTIEEKLHHRQHHSISWTKPVSLPIPFVRTRRLRLLVPNFVRIHQMSVSRFGRKRGPVLFCIALLGILYVISILGKRIHKEENGSIVWNSDPPTLVFRREDLQRIWKWEIESGHYPSRFEIPEQIGFTKMPLNPTIPPRKMTSSIPSRFKPPPGPYETKTEGIGAARVYLDIQSQPPNVAYPPRPVPGSIADLDVIMENCDYSKKKFVRDCLEVLRVGGGLDHGNRLRRGNVDDWKYIYQEQGGLQNSTSTRSDAERGSYRSKIRPAVSGDYGLDSDAGLQKRRGAEWEPPLRLPPPEKHLPYALQDSPCNEDKPRIFHMFWTGPFTDKPYLAILSFLFTQNTGIHLTSWPKNSKACQPKFWLWINPGPAASIPNPNALRDMFDGLKQNPWASPFLHPRFKDVVQFKLWNTTEQLDGIPEVKDEWRTLRDGLFNSGGHIVSVPAEKSNPQSFSSAQDMVNENGTVAAAAAPTGSHKGDEDDVLNRLGSKSPSTYDRLSVILSDMARFVLCHRFGGIYLDADTILLRDWEELWGWEGAFAYRWSRLEKYNTAVLRLNKGSALGTFLFKTALRNGLDFHPMTISRYTKEAYVEGLLLRLPDALFDSAWLNTEYFQRERPPQPYFQAFDDFFETPAQNSAAPQALGLDGFFKGAYSYHFHNFWWKPFDAYLNWPDLGPRFIAGERKARASASAASTDATTSESDSGDYGDNVDLDGDKRDLDWATVIKRTFEAYIRGERPNLYGEWIHW